LGGRARIEKSNCPVLPRTGPSNFLALIASQHGKLLLSRGKQIMGDQISGKQK
jgi:hypothetical protein